MNELKKTSFIGRVPGLTGRVTRLTPMDKVIFIYRSVRIKTKDFSIQPIDKRDVILFTFK